MFVLEGAYEVRCGGESFVAGPGTFVFVPKDVPNTFRNVAAIPSKMLYINSPGGFETFLENAWNEPATMIEAAQKHGIEILG